jgi:hypothetical protein
MTPVDADTERVRHCGDCNKNVYNLSQMTRDEAEALLLAKEGRLCVRYFQRKDGTILLKDCTVGVTNGRKRKLIAAGAAALLAGGVGAAFALRPHSENLSASIEQQPAGDEQWQGKLAVSNTDDPPPPEPVHEVKGRVAEPEYMPKMGDVDVSFEHDQLEGK